MLLNLLISLIIFPVDLEMLRIVEEVSLILVIFLSPVVLRVVSVSLSEIDSLFNVVSVIFFHRHVDFPHKLLHSGQKAIMLHIVFLILIIQVFSESLPVFIGMHFGQLQ